MQAARLGDMAYTPCPNKPPVSAIDVCQCATVFINGRPAAVVGDLLSAIPTTTITGSSTVFIEGKPAHRVGDMNGCGGTTFTGSPDTYIG